MSFRPNRFAMLRKKRLASISGRAGCLFVLLLLPIACDRAPAPATAPASSPATAPASPPATLPSACILQINDAAVPFPAARILIQHDGDSVSALLVTDEASDSADNSFYLSMNLANGPEAKLDDAVWDFKGADRVVEDSPDGIFLKGCQYRPSAVKATFHDRGAVVVVHIIGEFQLVDPTDTNAPAVLRVSADIDASARRQ